MFGPCFVTQYFVPFKFCNNLDGEDSWLLYFSCLPGVFVLLLFCGYPSWVSLQCDCGIS